MLTSQLFKLLAGAWLTLCGLSLYGSATEPVSFRNQIAPLLLEHCTACHGPKKAEGGYRLDSFAQLSQAGDSGIAPLVIEGDHTSELIRRLTTDDAGERMPAEREALSKEIIELIRRWQSEGSKFDGDAPDAPIFDIVPDQAYPSPPEAYSSPMPLTAVAFSPDGKQVIASGYHELTVWDAATGELAVRIPNMPERIYALDWSPDRKNLAVAGGSPGRIGEVRILDWRSGKTVKSLGRSTDVIQTVRYQANGQRLATGHADGTLRWFDSSDWHLIRSLASHADSVTDLRWSHDGLRLVSASRDKTAKVVDVESGELLATYSGHGEPVTGVCFNEDGKVVTSVGGDRKVHRWQIEGSKSLAKADLPSPATRLHIIGAQGWLALTGHTVAQVDLASTKVSRQFEGHASWVTALCTDPEAKHLVSGSLNGEVRLWKLEDGTCIHAWIAAPGFSRPASN